MLHPHSHSCCECQRFLLLPGWPQVKPSFSLNLCFLIYKIGVIIFCIYTPQGCEDQMRKAWKLLFLSVQRRPLLKLHQKPPKSSQSPASPRLQKPKTCYPAPPLAPWRPLGDPGPSTNPVERLSLPPTPGSELPTTPQHREGGARSEAEACTRAPCPAGQPGTICPVPRRVAGTIVFLL